MVFKNSISRKFQKNRFELNPKKIKIVFGDYSLITKNEGRLEFIQITMIKKLLKTFIKKKKSNVDVIREKIWYFVRSNFCLQKKSKNSRMGKGKGMIDRKIIRVRRGLTLFEFKGISFLKLRKFSKKINKILNVKTVIVFKKIVYIPLWSKQNKYIYYHDKYLI